MADRGYFKEGQGLTPKWRAVSGTGALLTSLDVFGWTAKLFKDEELLLTVSGGSEIVSDTPIPWSKNAKGYNVGIDFTDEDMNGAVAGHMYSVVVRLSTAEGNVPLEADYLCLPTKD